jgi:hypothetical protein
MSGIALKGGTKVFKRELLLRGVGRPRRQWIGHNDETDGYDVCHRKPHEPMIRAKLAAHLYRAEAFAVYG